MRHRLTAKPFSRNPSYRRQLLRNSAASLFQHGQITTTAARARAIRSFAERVITLGKTNDLRTRRLLISRMGSPKLASLILTKISPRFLKRNGGYTRIIKLGIRRGDNAQAVRLALVEDNQAVTPQKP